MKKFRFFSLWAAKLQAAFASFRNTLRQRITQRTLLLCVAYSVVLEFLVELLQRRSPENLLRYFIDSPAIPLCNLLIITLTMSAALFFKRKYFVYAVIASLWVGLAVTNFIVLGYRYAPLNMSDLFIVRAAIGMFTLYLSVWQAIGILLLIASAAALIVLIWKKAPRQKTAPKKCITFSASLLAGVFLTSSLAVHANALDRSPENLYETYDKYGFAYCFSLSVLESGIEAPDNYSEAYIDRLIGSAEKETELPAAEEVQRETRPNLIFVQLESFFDPKRLAGFTYSGDPVPNFTELSGQYSAGHLNVTTIGGGTANTEFEVLTGMSLRYFGLGECPYYTVLNHTSCESLASNLKDAGYHTHALHNHLRKFYDREDVYPNIGFEEFRSLEDMTVSDFNPLGYAKDTVLTGEIINALRNSEGRDFVFAVSVQGHGKYPETDEYADADAAVTIGGYEEGYAGEDPDAFRCAFDYYINQMYETDRFIGELIEALEGLDEPVIAVIYGDHMPGLDFESLTLNEGTEFQTDYLIWDNLGMEKSDADVPSYRLTARLSELTCMRFGTLPDYHLAEQNSRTYASGLGALQYDILYGNQYVYDD